MKNLILLGVLCISSFCIAQSPQQFTYQSVIRNASGNLVLNSTIGIRISIRQASASGTIVFQEEHTPTTNSNGLASLEIGAGTLVTGSFSTIDWGSGPYFLETEVDPLGGTSYTINGTSQLLSVPYSLYASKADSVANDQINDADADPANELQDLSLSGTNLSISSGNSVDLSAIQDGTGSDDQTLSLSGTDLSIESGNTVDLSGLQDGVNDADADPMNELQDLSLSGTNLSISSGNSVDLSAIQDGTGSDDQTLSLSGTDLSIESGNTVDLSGLQDGVNDADSDPTNELQAVSFSNDTLYLSDGGQVYLGAYGIDLVNDADNDPNNEIELPATANPGDLLEFDGTSWVAAAPAGSNGPGAVMYIYNGQTCPSGWTTQQVNVAIFGGVAVDACWTDTPCVVMYIYDGQTCPTGWTLQPIGAAVVNGSTLPVDACFKCY